MKLASFDYNLPDERIAKYPPEVRGTTSLMVIDRGRGDIKHRKYSDIVDYLENGDVLVINNTKVEKVRVFFVNSRNGKRIEALFLTKVYRGEGDYEYWESILGRAKYIDEGDRLKSEVKGSEIEVEKIIEGSIFLVKAKRGSVEAIFNNEGHVPIPPYLNRDDSADDYVRYNTIFAKKEGSSASPTSGLNMTDEMFDKLRSKGVKIVEVQLNVGWGTFAPIRTESIEDHRIHQEYIEVSKESAKIVNECIEYGSRVFALGTTSARTLESVSYLDEKKGKYFIKEYSGNTSIYIYPGYEWRVVSGLVTNFHAPKSSLLVMISSFAGYDLAMRAYKEALDSDYMFLSYGDSMIIL